MFRGSMPAALRPHVVSTAATWKSPDVWIGCSGNFTLERTIHGIRPDLRLHSNDITLYSSAIGAYLAGGDLGFQLVDRVRERHPWAAPSFDDGDRTTRLAALLQATRWCQSAFGEGRWHERNIEGFRRQYATLLEKTEAKLRALKTRCEDFHAGDVVDWLDQAPSDAAVAMYPPFEGAEKAFEADFAQLETMFEWDEPEFVELTDERRDHLYATIRDRKEWLLGSSRRFDGPEWEERLRGIAQTTNRGVPVYVYSSEEARVALAPRQQTERVPGKRLLPGQELEGPLRLAEITHAQFATLRSAYMNAHIRPGSAQIAVAVLAGDHLIGVFAAIARPTQYVDPFRAYLLSDFPVAPTDYPRLSKLVLYAALSREAEVLYKRAGNADIRRILTTAFSQNPVSMKYRGLFQLHSRKELDLDKEAWAADIPRDDPYYSQKWMLNYLSDTGRWSLAEGLAEWQQKHGKRIEHETRED